MKFVVLAAGVTLLIVLIWFFGPRLVKTAWLIIRVSPYEQTVPGDKTVLVLGDSTGYGTGASKATDSIAGRIGQDFPSYTIENNSVNGRTIGELQEVANEIEGRYELILLQIGGNDILQERNLDVVEIELKNLVSKLSERTDNLVMISTGNVGGASAFTTTESQKYETITREFRKMFIRVGENTNLTYVDLFVEPENDPFINEPEKYLAVDGLHPSSAGYGYWYQVLQPTLQEKLSP